MAILLALNILGCDGGGGDFPDGGAGSDFALALDVTPAEMHPGVELTLTFIVTHDGVPDAETVPEFEFEGPAMGTISTAPGSEPGTHVGTHTFAVDGTYAIHAHFTDHDGMPQELSVPLVIAPEDMH